MHSTWTSATAVIRRIGVALMLTAVVVRRRPAWRVPRLLRSRRRQPPRAQAAPAPQARVFSGELGLMFNVIKPDKTADFEMVMGKLKEAFAKARRLTGRGEQDLLVAVIESIGVLGDDTAAEVFLPILRRKATDSQSRKLARWLIESLGAVAQQGGRQSLEALLELTGHSINDIRSLGTPVTQHIVEIFKA